MDSAENQILFYKPLRRIFMKKRTAIARIAILFAVMLTIHYVTSFILEFVPSGIQPTLVHIPVVIASVIYRQRIGAVLGLLMGLFSVTMNTLAVSYTHLTLPTNSRV